MEAALCIRRAPHLLHAGSPRTPCAQRRFAPSPFGIRSSSSSSSSRRHCTYRTAQCSSKHTRGRAVVVVGCAGAATAAQPPSPPPAPGLGALWKFTRPHTIRGTILGSTAMTARVLMDNSWAIDWSLVPRALLGVLALLCGNGYIVGINQIYDVKIDKISKPFLPIAAGKLSPSQAWIACIVMAIAGLAVVQLNFGLLILVMYVAGLFLGTIYSVPPFRLKKNPVAAALIIACVRGFFLNFGVYTAARAALGLSFQWSPPVVFITCFVTAFALVIAISKDLPDVEGDKKDNIKTFASSLGVAKLARFVIGSLFTMYAISAAVPFLYPGNFNPLVMTPLHILLAVLMLVEFAKLSKAKFGQEAIKAFYRTIWTALYCEYIFFPFI